MIAVYEAFRADQLFLLRHVREQHPVLERPDRAELRGQRGQEAGFSGDSGAGDHRQEEEGVAHAQKLVRGQDDGRRLSEQDGVFVRE